MDTCLRILVLSTLVLAVLGGYPGFIGHPGYHQPLAAPVFYHHPQPVFSYNAITNNHLPAAAAVRPWERHFYSTPSNIYRGYAYQTQYLDGGNSQVVFVTGPESQQLMQQSFEEFRKLSLLPSTTSSKTESKTDARTANVPNVVSNIEPRIFATPFVRHPFPFQSFSSSFYNAVPVAPQNAAESTSVPDETTSSSNVEVSAVPVVISNRINDVSAASSTMTTAESTTVMSPTTTASTTTTAAAATEAATTTTTTTTAAAATEAAMEAAATAAATEAAATTTTTTTAAAATEAAATALTTTEATKEDEPEVTNDDEPEATKEDEPEATKEDESVTEEESVASTENSSSSSEEPESETEGTTEAA